MMIGAIHQRHAGAWMTEILAKGQTAKTRAEDKHMGFVRIRHAELFIRRWKNATIPGSLVIQLQLAQVLYDGIHLRAKGKSPTGGDLYLHLQISD